MISVLAQWLGPSSPRGSRGCPCLGTREGAKTVSLSSGTSAACRESRRQLEKLNTNTCVPLLGAAAG